MRGHTQMRRNSWTYIVDFESDPLTGKRKQTTTNGFTSQKEAHLALCKYLIEAEEKHISIILEGHLMRGCTQKRGNSWRYIVDFERHPLTGKRKQTTTNGFTSQKEAHSALCKYLSEAEEKHISILEGHLMRGCTQKRGNSWTYIVAFERDSLTGKRKQTTKSGFTSQKEAQAALCKYLGKVEEMND